MRVSIAQARQILQTIRVVASDMIDSRIAEDQRRDIKRLAELVKLLQDLHKIS